jgi:hypothetical protein
MKSLLFLIFVVSILSFSAKAEDNSSFWSKTDEFLKLGADLLSKEDKITGLRSLNMTSDSASKRRGSRNLDLIIQDANKQSVKIFQSGDAEYERVKAIVKRVIQASHYRNETDIRFEVIDFEDVNAFAFGGGNFVIFTGLMNVANDDELAYVIAHELAHNAASHNEEQENFMRMKDVVGNKPSSDYRTAFTNIYEQEADRIGIVYTALAGYDPCASATYWEKQKTYLQDYSFFRSHPANPQRSQANRKACAIISKHYTKGIVSPDVEAVLKCNDLFCNFAGNRPEAGKGGGVVAVIELLADTVIKNEQAEAERKQQEADIAEAKRLLAQEQLITPPNINWGAGWNIYKGTIERHKQKAGLNFAISNGQGQFFYNFNNEVHQGNLQFHSQNEHGYWFRWQDNWGAGLVSLKEFTDGSMRGHIYMDNGTNPGEHLGEFIGYR